MANHAQKALPAPEEAQVVDAVPPPPRHDARWKWQLFAVVLVVALLGFSLWNYLPYVGLGLLLLGGLFCIYWVIMGLFNLAERRVAYVARRAAVEKELAELAEQQQFAARHDYALIQRADEQVVGVFVRPDDPRGIFVPLAQPETYHYHAAKQPALHNGALPELPPLPMKETALPRAAIWEVIEPQIGPDRFYLGETASGSLYVPLDGVITLVNIGPQGLGKTTLERSLALQMVLTGGDLAICDWYNDVAAEMAPFFPHCYSEPEDCDAFAGDLLIPEMTRRHAAYKLGKRDFPPLLWLVDEWGMLKKDCPTMAEALANALTVWRKLNLRTVISSVQIDARDLGVSKSAVSTLALFSGNENLAKTWGLSGIKPQLDQLYTAGPGYCLISSQTMQRQAELVAVPHVTADRFREVISRRRPALLRREAGESVGTSGSARVLPFPHSQPSPAARQEGILTLREREYIALRYRAGVGRVAIRDELRAQRKDGFSNRHWQELKTICDAIDQEEEAQA